MRLVYAAIKAATEAFGVGETAPRFQDRLAREGIRRGFETLVRSDQAGTSDKSDPGVQGV